MQRWKIDTCWLVLGPFMCTFLKRQLQGKLLKTGAPDFTTVTCLFEILRILSALYSENTMFSILNFSHANYICQVEVETIFTRRKLSFIENMPVMQT